MGQPPRSPLPLPLAPADDQRVPVVAVRDIKPVNGSLWAVSLRVANGQVVTVVIDKRLATVETVEMAAHVVAMLSLTGRKHFLSRH